MGCGTVSDFWAFSSDPEITSLFGAFEIWNYLLILTKDGEERNLVPFQPPMPDETLIKTRKLLRDFIFKKGDAKEKE